MSGRFRLRGAFSLLLSAFVALTLSPLSRVRLDASAAMALCFCKGATAGSDAQFNPIISFVNCSLDPLQVSES